MPGEARTIAELFLNRVDADGDRAAVRLPFREPSVVSWTQWAEAVFRGVDRLDALGIRPGDRVALHAGNSWGWIVADLAAQLAGAVLVPLHQAASQEAIVAQLAATEPKLIITDAPRESTGCAAEIVGVEEWLASDAGDLLRGRRLAESRLAEIGPETLSTVLFTAGTSGAAKGVMLSHGNLVANAVNTVACFERPGPEVRFNLLPLSHGFARTCDLLIAIADGSELVLSRGRDEVLADAAETRPTVLNAVPYFFDRIAALLPKRPGVSLQDLFGGRLAICCCGGAAIRPETVDLFESQGVLLRPGYGLSEAGPVVTVSTYERARAGSVGCAVRGVELRREPDGELLVRSPSVMQGYWRDEAATAEAFRDGWLATGDLAEIDPEGFVRIVGRKKELLVTSTGRKLAPGPIERQLERHPRIAQAVVLGEGRRRLAALVLPADGETADVRSEVAAAIRQQCEALAPWERIEKFEILPRPLSVEAGELTPKLSVCRFRVEENFADLIERIDRGAPVVH